MNPLFKQLSQTPVFYVTRDIERAIGISSDIANFFIISNYSEFAKYLTKTHKNILLVKSIKKLDTWQLLEHPSVKQYIDTNKKNIVNILVFKTTKQIERICQDNGWKLLNNSAELSGIIEQKISQMEWAQEHGIASLFLDYRILKCKDIRWGGEASVLQFNYSHTGSGTILIDSEKKLQEIQKKFPIRPCRIAQYISGPLFTNNNVIWDNKVLLGNINYQITGLKPFTNSVFATIGNDWALPHKILNKEQMDQFYNIAKIVGEKMKLDGWRGMFGIDVVMDQKNNKMHLLEINARQPAGTSFESILQTKNTEKNGINIFVAYLSSLLNIPYQQEKIINIQDGAQIILRNTEKNTAFKNITNIQMELEKIGINTIKYDNTATGSDLLRIQSKQGIMKDHNVFNDSGKKILNILNNYVV